MTNAPDSIASMLLPSVPKPQDLVEAAQKQVALTQYALERQQAALNVVQGQLDHATSALIDANKKLNDAVSTLANVRGAIANVENQITDAQKRLLGIPQTVVHQVCSNTVTRVGVCIFNPPACLVTQVVCHNETTVNGAWQSVTNLVTDLPKKKNELEGQLQSAGVQKAAALEEISVETPLKAQAEAQKATLQFEYQSAQRALNLAQQTLAEAKKMAAQLPWLPDFPKPGELKLDRVRLIANGREIANFAVSDRLKQGHPTWRRPLLSLNPAEEYVRNLRVNLNQASSWTDEEASSVTTVFKIAGVSGWEAEPVQSSRGVGKLLNPPSPGADGYVSLDLELERVETLNYGFVLDGKSGIPHTRYIRIEYKHLNPSGADDDRYKSWKVGQRLAVEGPALRDTDRWEFSELHPTVSAQVVPLQAGESGATSSVILFFRRLIHH